MRTISVKNGWQIVLVLVGVLSGIILMSGSLNVAMADAGSAQLVWSQGDADNQEIYFSRRSGNAWDAKTRLSQRADKDILPCVALGRDGVVWVVWTAMTGNSSSLYSTHLEGGVWSTPQKITTGLAANTAPSLVVDGQNRAWLVWAGYDGNDDDIFFTRHIGQQWQAPVRVNLNDTTPDITPVIGIGSNGMPWVHWRGYSNGKYRSYISQWSGNGWQAETTVEGDSVYHSALLESLKNVPELPGFLADGNTAAIHIADSDQIQSIPLRTLGELTATADPLPKIEATRKLAADNTDASRFLDDASRSLDLIEYYVGFGDSITFGIEGDGYENDLERLLISNGRNAKVFNWGVRGETTADGVNRIDEPLGWIYAHFYLILEGTNDILAGLSYETTMNNLELMIDKVKAAGSTPILSNLTPDTRFDEKNGPIVQIYNPGIATLGERKEIRVCNQHGALASQWGYYSDDGLHPNHAGYSVMAETWYKTINSLPVPTVPKAFVLTDLAVDIGTQAARLKGRINPKRVPTTYYFEWGETDTYGNKTPLGSAGNGDQTLTVTNVLTGLKAGKTYHYRLVGQSDGGISRGRDVFFNTASKAGASGDSGISGEGEKETESSSDGGGGGGCFISTALGSWF